MKSSFFIQTFWLLLLVASNPFSTRAQNVKRIVDEACDCLDEKLKHHHRIIVQYMYDYVELGEETAERNLKSRFSSLSSQEQERVKEDVEELDKEIGEMVQSCLSKIKGMELNDEQLEEMKEELINHKSCHPLLYWIASNKKDDDEKKEQEESNKSSYDINPNESPAELADDVCSCAYEKINQLHPIVQELLVEIVDMDDSDSIIQNYKRRYNKLSSKEQQQASADIEYLESESFKEHIFSCLKVVNQLNDEQEEALLNAIKQNPYCKKMVGAIKVIKSDE